MITVGWSTSTSTNEGEEGTLWVEVRGGPVDVTYPFSGEAQVANMVFDKYLGPKVMMMRVVMVVEVEEEMRGGGEE